MSTFIFASMLLLLSTSLLADRVRFLRDDRDAMQARVDVLQQADKEIFIEYFSVENDNLSMAGLILLVDAAKRGIKVRVILDDLASNVPKETFAALLAKSYGPDGKQNLEIKKYNPVSLKRLKDISKRDHAKMIIVDGEVLITGGRNVGGKYFGQHEKGNYGDLDMMAKGSLAASARKNYVDGWKADHVEAVNLGLYSPENLHPEYCAQMMDSIDCEMSRLARVKKVQQESARIDEINGRMITEEDKLFVNNTGKDWFVDSFDIKDTKFISHDPTQLVTEESAHLNAELLNVIAKAKDEICITTPYLVPADDFVAVLEHLQKQNVKVKIITNSKTSTDNPLAHAGYLEDKKKLIKLGVELYEYNGPDTLHAKSALIDNQIVLIGTYNSDVRSAILNREMGAIVDDSEQTGFAKEQAENIEHFRNKSTLVGKDGKEFKNPHDEKVPFLRNLKIESLRLIVPVIRDQL